MNIYLSKGTEKQISNANKIKGDRFYLMNAQQIHTADRYAPADFFVRHADELRSEKFFRGYRDVKINFSFASFKLPIISFAISLETDEKTCDVLEVGAITYMDYYFDIIRRIFI